MPQYILESIAKVPFELPHGPVKKTNKILLMFLANKFWLVV